MLANKTANLSNRKNVRDFIFIKDVISAYESVLKNYNKIENGEVFNIGYGTQFSIEDVARIVGARVKWTQSRRPKERGRIWQADISKIKKSIGWHPKYRLSDGIQETKKWMVGNIKFYEDT